MKILRLLKNSDTTYYAKMEEALACGYQSAYETLFDSVYDTFDRESCSFVLNVMSMYEALQRSAKAQKNGAKVSLSEVAFRGFDGNHETDQMAYARYVRDQEQRFTQLEPTKSDFNSHMPSIGRYRAQLAAWEKLGKSYDLDEAQMRTVLNAK